MSKKTRFKGLLLSIVVTAGCLSLYVGFTGNPITRHKAPATIRNYLTQTGMYADGDFTVGKGLASKSSFCRYGTSVTFADEPDVLYYYSICKDGTIIQDGYSSTAARHQK